MPLPADYAERVYAGVLGKIIGVYLGRPFEGWTHKRIQDELGEIHYYVHAKLNKPLIVTDDDIAGTFTFLRALADYDDGRNITPAQIGQTWLNYLIENMSVLWWGGMGNSTEHTAFLRLKHGMPAPQSGSIAANGKTIAEQIGAQIFIDGWAMVAPGDPELAAELARKAASVSHDGEAIHGAQALAAMESLAFVEHDLTKLINAACRFIPGDSLIYRLIQDVCEWHDKFPDWRKARQSIERRYGYDRYGGNCHMVPNHAIILLGLLYGDDDFQKSLMITNTSGWDTDCNSANVGCLMGIKNGLAGIDAGPDWRGPVADRLYLPTADGGRAISDAVTETYHIVNLGCKLSGEAPLAPKNGARFHFDLPGSVQGFQAENDLDCSGVATVENAAGHSRSGNHSLAIHYHKLATGRAARVSTPTFVPPDALAMPGYNLHASPTLYPGQTVRAVLAAGSRNNRAVMVTLYVAVYGAGDRLLRKYGPRVLCKPGETRDLTWTIGDMGGAPIASIGIELTSEHHAEGVIYLDYVTWDGTPSLRFVRPAEDGSAWTRAWVSSLSSFRPRPGDSFRLIQNEGRAMATQGTRQWDGYRLQAAITPRMLGAGGIAVHVQGLMRYYALLLCSGGKLRLVKVLDDETTLGETELEWLVDHEYTLTLQVRGGRLQAWLGNELVFDVEEPDVALTSGAIGLICQDGCLDASAIAVRPASV